MHRLTFHHESWAVIWPLEFDKKMKLFIYSLLIALVSSMAATRQAAKAIREVTKRLSHQGPPPNIRLARQRVERAIRAAKNAERQAAKGASRRNLMNDFNDAAGNRIITPNTAARKAPSPARRNRINAGDNGFITPEITGNAAKKASPSSSGAVRQLFNKK